MALALQLGSIVWTEIADANGIAKVRPAIVVTPTDHAAKAVLLHVVAITSRLIEPLSVDHVLLPWHPKGHPRTKLNRRSAAVCTWIAQIQPEDVREVAGIVPGPAMVEIVGRIAANAPPPSSGS